MTWLAWRQIRAQAAASALALAALALLLVFSAARGAHLGGDLIQALRPTQRHAYIAGDAILILLPAVIGVFWGAPLAARELEAGTYRLAWTQTVSRARWLWTKIGLSALVTLATAAFATLLIGWWSAPIDRAIATGGDRGGLYVTRVEPLAFDARGIVPSAHALLALVLGVTVGLLIRRTLPAMAVTLAIVIALQVAMPLAIRQHLVAPVRTVVAIPTDSPILLGVAGDAAIQVHAPGGWLLSSHVVDRRGQTAPFPTSFVSCLRHGGEAAPPRCIAALNRQGYREQITEHPARQFWALQLAESAVFLTLSLILCGLCAWRIKRI